MDAPPLSPPANGSPAVRRSAALVEALRNPTAYPHPVGRVEVVETHISWVFLAGDYAYKVKKPVKLPFLDFSSLEARRFYCEEEVRINSRSAPQIYLGMTPIAGDPPVIGGEGPPIEYAVKMRRFASKELLSRLACAGLLDEATIDKLAARVAALHETADVAPWDGHVESAARAVEPALDNFLELRRMEARAPIRRGLDLLSRWTEVEGQALAGVFAARRERGFVRECHGDLHLGNVALVGGIPLPFDALEFSVRLRWGDVMGDVAFMMMDLVHHGLPALAARFLNAYLERTGDYEGVRVLRFYMVYRAMVRAKIERIRAEQQPPGSPGRREALEAFEGHVRLAGLLAGDGHAAIIAMHGPSGSGKTVVSQRLLEELGAVRIRSDVERKRMGIDTYGPHETRRVYARLAHLAQVVVAGDFPVVVDAACLERWQRYVFADVAHRARVPLRIVSCEAGMQTLRERVRRRSAQGADASEATVEVLERQLEWQRPLDADEARHATVLDTGDEPAWNAAIETLAREMRAAQP